MVLGALARDLGARAGGTPASIWRWPSVLGLLRPEGWGTGALLQSSWGRAFAKPTRLLFNLPGLAASLFMGLSRLDDNDKYQGPLPKVKAAESLIGKSGAEFKMVGTEAWPSELRRELARLVWKAFRGGPGKRASAPADGVGGAVLGACAGTGTRTTEAGMLSVVGARRGRVDGAPGDVEVYIGRGHRGLGLGRTKCSNPSR